MENDQNESWLKNNLKWILPIGCLVPLCCLIFIGAIVAVALTSIRSSSPYELAISTASSDPRLIDILGNPIEDGWPVLGNISIQTESGGNFGEADFSIPLSGPRSAGTLYVNATQSGGVWTVDRLDFMEDGSEQVINLLGR